MRLFGVIIALVVLIAAAGAGVWYFAFNGAAPSGISGSASGTYTFDDADAGLSFNYPKTYTFESYPLDGETESWVSLQLVRTADKQAAEQNGASEGPVAITVGIFTNDNNQSLEDWVKTDTNSNFNLSSDSKLAPATVGGEQALAYTYGGLFENDAVAVAHAGKIYLFGVSWIDAKDPMRTDFQNLLKTVQFK